MTTVATDGVACEIAAADRGTDDRNGTECLGFIHNLAQPFLVGGGRNGASQIDGCCTGCVADAFVVGFEGIPIHAVVLLVVVCEGDDDVITCFHLLLGALPEFVVTTAGVTSSSGVVDGCPTVGQEVAEVHAPTTGYGG